MSLAAEAAYFDAFARGQESMQETVDGLRTEIERLQRQLRTIHEEYAFAVLSASTLPVARERCERIAQMTDIRDLDSCTKCGYVHSCCSTDAVGWVGEGILLDTIGVGDWDKDSLYTAECVRTLLDRQKKVYSGKIITLDPPRVVLGAMAEALAQEVDDLIMGRTRSDDRRESDRHPPRPL